MPAAKRRCDWGQGNDLMQAYHDEEWGVPLHGDQTPIVTLSEAKSLIQTATHLCT